MSRHRRLEPHVPRSGYLQREVGDALRSARRSTHRAPAKRALKVIPMDRFRGELRAIGRL